MVALSDERAVQLAKQLAGQYISATSPLVTEALNHTHPAERAVGRSVLGGGAFVPYGGIVGSYHDGSVILVSMSSRHQRIWASR